MFALLFVSFSLLFSLIPVMPCCLAPAALTGSCRLSGSQAVPSKFSASVCTLSWCSSDFPAAVAMFKWESSSWLATGRLSCGEEGLDLDLACSYRPLRVLLSFLLIGIPLVTGAFLLYVAGE